MKTRVLYLATALLFSTGLFAQDSLPVIPKPPAWGLEVYAGGGLARVSPISNISVLSGPLSVASGFTSQAADEFFMVSAPATRTTVRETTYREGRNITGGVELLRNIGLDWSVYAGLNFSYLSINSLNAFVRSETIQMGSPADTVFISLGEPTTGIEQCADDEFPSQEQIEESNRQYSRLANVGIPVGVRCNLPHFPLRLRAQISVHSLIYQRFFREELAALLDGDCVRYGFERGEVAPEFAIRNLTLRGALGAEIKVLPVVHFGLQVEQQLTNSVEQELSFSNVDFSSSSTRSAFRPLYFSAVVRYSLR